MVGLFCNQEEKLPHQSMSLPHQSISLPHQSISLPAQSMDLMMLLMMKGYKTKKAGTMPAFFISVKSNYCMISFLINGLLLFSIFK